MKTEEKRTRGKVSKDNTITIRKSKDNYTKEEIIQKGLEFLKFLAQDHNHKFNTYKDAWKFWTKDNL